MENEINNSNENPTTTSDNSSAKKWIIIGVVALLLLFILQSIFFSPERIAERMLEQAGGGEYDISIDNDGSYTATSDDESVTFSAGGEAEVPQGWPDSVPLPNNATVAYATAVTGTADDTVLSMTVTTTESASEVAEFYANALGERGWTIETQFTSGSDEMISATHSNGDVASIYASSAEGVTSVILSVQKVNP